MILTLPHCSTIFVSILIVLFVVSSWIDLSGVWIQFPLMVNQLPEGWRLPAIMGLVANLANIGVVVIAVIRRFSHGRVTYEIPANIFILAGGAAVLVLLSFLWNKTVTISGKERSVYLMALSLFLATVDCTSSVTFLPFLDRYEEKYVNAYFFGEALSSLFPALLGIAQGVGQTSCIANGTGPLTEYNSPPRFSIQAYLLALAAFMVSSLISFIILCLTRMGRRKDLVSVDDTNIKNDSPVADFKAVDKHINRNVANNNNLNYLESEHQMTRNEFWLSRHGLYLFLCFWTSILIIGATPSIQSYSLYPYSIEVYHRTIIACQFAYPLMTLLGVFIPRIRARYMYILTVIGTGLFAYTFAAAKMSPCSPLVDRLIGKIVIGVTWVLKYCVLYFIRVLLGNYFRRKSGHRGLFWFGVLTQIGSLVGAILIYLFTEHLDFFHERKICVSYSC